jgi:hypothetical protein
MLLTAEEVLAECQRLETMLREVQQRTLVARPEILGESENELAEIAILLETLHQSTLEHAVPSVLLRGNPAVRQVLQQIQRVARQLKIQLEHGSNYCAGLLQIRLGTGYSEHGQAVLAPSQARSSFEG